MLLQQSSQDLVKTEKFARLQLIRANNIGPITFWNLINKYKTAINALDAIKKDQQSDDVIIREKASKFKFNTYKLKEEIDLLKRLNGRFVFFDDVLYPPMLKKIQSPPVMLVMLGDVFNAQKLISQPSLSVVGGRNASINAQNLCKEICKKISSYGITVVSGLANGIDSIAHEASIKNTIAIMAGGADVVYPVENEMLYKEIIKNGVVFSQMPLGTEIQSGFFPQRNRIIAGISSSLLVIEAKLYSGSLITAKHALENNRNIYAVPGFPGDARSAGCNQLIKDGAFLAENYQDILQSYVQFDKSQVEFSSIKQTTQVANCDVKSFILSLLSNMPVSINEILLSVENSSGVNKLYVSTKELLSTITELELEGKIKRDSSGKVCLLC